MAHRASHDGSVAAAAFVASIAVGFLLSLVAWPLGLRPVALWVGMVLPLTVHWVIVVRSLREAVARAEARMAVEAKAREAVWVLQGGALVRERAVSKPATKTPRLWLWWLLCAPLALFVSWFLSFAGVAGAVVIGLGVLALAAVRAGRLIERGLDAPIERLMHDKTR